MTTARGLVVIGALLAISFFLRRASDVPEIDKRQSAVPHRRPEVSPL
jgi:hypothetical protein